MPLEICKFSRHKRIKISKDEFEIASSKVVLRKTIVFMDINFSEFAQFSHSGGVEKVSDVIFVTLWMVRKIYKIIISSTKL